LGRFTDGGRLKSRGFFTFCVPAFCYFRSVSGLVRVGIYLPLPQTFSRGLSDLGFVGLVLVVVFSFFSACGKLGTAPSAPFRPPGPCLPHERSLETSGIGSSFIRSPVPTFLGTCSWTTPRNIVCASRHGSFLTGPKPFPFPPSWSLTTFPLHGVSGLTRGDGPPKNPLFWPYFEGPLPPPLPPPHQLAILLRLVFLLVGFSLTRKGRFLLNPGS